MNTSSLEITEHEYLIKLKKEDFDLSFINQLVKRIQTENTFFNFRNYSDTEEDIIVGSKHDFDVSARFDHLTDK